VLKRHWPEVPCYDDVRTLTAERLAADGIGVDAICGGFPCQDISTAGKGAGMAGERSGLWSEYARLVGELRPRYVLVENVAALLGRGLERVLGDLAALGYDAEWHCIPASAVGAPHIRDRVWIIAYPQHTDADEQRPYRATPDAPGQSGKVQSGDEQICIARQVREPVSYAIGNELRDEPGRRNGTRRTDPTVQGEHAGAKHAEVAGLRQNVADASIGGRRGIAIEDARGDNKSRRAQEPPEGCGGALADARRLPAARHQRIVWEVGQSDWWCSEPDVGRVAHGVPSRVDRLRALGNAVVPQIPELTGRAILASLETTGPRSTP
jgi:DNA (cytosine-5)-methyltransferase 1